MTVPTPILVDTSVWVDFFSRSPGLAGVEMRKLIADSEPVVLAGIVITEILQGLVRDAKKIEAYLAQWEILEPKGPATYVGAAEIFRLARSQGLTLTTVDVLIAALALENQAALFTLDRDFVRLTRYVPLRLYWTL